MFGCADIVDDVREDERKRAKILIDALWQAESVFLAHANAALESAPKVSFYFLNEASKCRVAISKYRGVA